MTREEATYLLNNLRSVAEGKENEAIDMAIEALQTIDNCGQCEWCCPSDGIPTIHVVRCKDCKYRYVSGNGTTQYYVCDFMDAQYEDDGFCHHGESEAGE